MALPFPRLLHPHSSPPQTYGLLYKVGWNVVNLERYAKGLLGMKKEFI